MNQMVTNELNNLFANSPIRIIFPTDVLMQDLQEFTTNAQSSSTNTETGLLDIKGKSIGGGTPTSYSYKLKFVVVNHPSASQLAKLGLTEEVFLNTYLVDQLQITTIDKNNIAREYPGYFYQVNNMQDQPTRIGFGTEVTLTFETNIFPVSNTIKDFLTVQIGFKSQISSGWFALTGLNVGISKDPGLILPIRSIFNLDNIIGYNEMAIFNRQSIVPSKFDFSRTNKYAIVVDSDIVVPNGRDIVNDVKGYLATAITQIKEIPNINLNSFKLVEGNHGDNDIDLTISFKNQSWSLAGGSRGKEILFRVDVNINTAFHELGHYLGLGHQPGTVKTVMSYGVYPPEVRYTKLDLYNIERIIKASLT